MDLEEWEFIPDDGFLEIHDDGGKKIFSRKYDTPSNSVFNMNYFTCPSPKSQKFVDSSEDSRLPKQLVPFPIQLDHEITKVPIEISIKPPYIGGVEADQDAFSQVFFKKMKENEFVDMKMDSPRSGNRGIIPQIDSGSFHFEEKSEAIENKKCSSKMTVEKDEMEITKKNNMDSSGINEDQEALISWEESHGGLNVWKWSLNGIGAICSFGVTAATICIIILGSGKRIRHEQNKQKLRFQLYSDDKRMNRMNEAISTISGVPFTRAHITVGGYYDAHSL